MADSNAIPRTPDPETKAPLRLKLADKLGLIAPIRVLAFPSFGTPDLLHVRGRVAEQNAVGGTAEQSSFWENMRTAVERLGSNDIPGARLRARFAGRELETTSDHEGFFVFNLAPPAPLDGGWHEVEVELLESIGEPAEQVVRARVLVPDAATEFAVISDLDDTVIESHATDKLRQIALTFGKGPQERVAFPGVPELYRALTAGSDGQGRNPIFYTSRSGWNLSDLFVEFLEANRIPMGPLLLSDLRVFESRSKVLGDDRDKFGSIDLLLRTYADLPFVLLGDTGQHDPELYLQVARAHPGRIAAVYLHDVGESGRNAEVRQAVAALEAEGIPVRLSEDALRAAEHAAGEGRISGGGLEEVRRAVMES